MTDEESILINKIKDKPKLYCWLIETKILDNNFHKRDMSDENISKIKKIMNSDKKKYTDDKIIDLIKRSKNKLKQEYKTLEDISLSEYTKNYYTKCYCKIFTFF